MSGVKSRPDSIQEVLDRYPCLVGHMVCQSLGYFTPHAAANALLHYIRGEPFACEWYTHMGGMCRGEWPSSEKLLEVGRTVVESSFRRRHSHQGYMAHYPQAKALVEAVRRNGEPAGMLASWF